jgi:hypothetical protein
VHLVSQQNWGGWWKNWGLMPIAAPSVEPPLMTSFHNQTYIKETSNFLVVTRSSMRTGIDEREYQSHCELNSNL